MRTVNFSDARANLKKVLDTVNDDRDVTLIKRRDAEDAVVMSLSEYNAWRETVYLMSNPANAAHLMKSIAELNAGKVVRHELVEPEQARAVAEPPPPAYDARPRKRRSSGKQRG